MRGDEWGFKRKDGTQYVVRMTVDDQRLVNVLGPRASRSPRGTATALNRGVVVTIVSDSRPRPKRS